MRTKLDTIAHLEPPTLEVRFFASSQGTEPVRDWLRSLPAADRRTIGEDLKTVQFGWPLGMPLVRKLAERLWEVRVHLDDRTARVLFTVVDGKMVLLNGFIKKSRATPKAEFDLTRQRLRLLESAV